MGNLCSSGAKPTKEKSAGPTGKPKSIINGSRGYTHTALKMLGKGTAADTYLFEDHVLSKPIAMKLFIRPIENFPADAVQREVMDCLGLGMEWGEGGSMIQWLENRIQHVKSKGDLVIPEEEARYFFRQLISAVAYCHAHGIAHRDLKLDNSLLDGSNPPVLKLCDFGFAAHFGTPSEMSETHLGTPEYMSPELLHRTTASAGTNPQFDARRADIWAVGVMLVVWLCGAFAFDTQDHMNCQNAEEELWKDENRSSWKESPHIKENVASMSPEVVDLLDQIFHVKPEERITIDGIKKHPWYTKDLSPKYQAAIDDLQKQQKSLEDHVSKQRYDKEKVKARSEAIRDMIQKAVTPKQGKKGKFSFKQNQTLDLKGPGIETISLAESSIVSGGEMTEEEAKIVRERFNRISVTKAVQTAFEGDKKKDLHNAAEQARSSRT